MQNLNYIYQNAQDYYQEIPANTGKEALYGFGAGFIIETIFFTGNLSKGAIAGALSALATTIYGLVTPLFKELVGNRPLTWGEEMCRTFTAIIGTGCVAAACGNSSILNNLGSLAILFGVIIYIDPARCNLNSTNRIIIFPIYF